MASTVKLLRIFEPPPPPPPSSFKNSLCSIYSYHSIIYGVLLSILITVLNFFGGFIKIYGETQKYNLSKKNALILFYGIIVFLQFYTPKMTTKTYRNVLFLELLQTLHLNPIFYLWTLFIPSFGIAGTQLNISTLMIFNL